MLTAAARPAAAVAAALDLATLLCRAARASPVSGRCRAGRGTCCCAMTAGSVSHGKLDEEVRLTVWRFLVQRGAADPRDGQPGQRPRLPGPWHPRLARSSGPVSGRSRPGLAGHSASTSRLRWEPAALSGRPRTGPRLADQRHAAAGSPGRAGPSATAAARSAPGLGQPVQALAILAVKPTPPKRADLGRPPTASAGSEPGDPGQARGEARATDASPVVDAETAGPTALGHARGRPGGQLRALAEEGLALAAAAQPGPSIPAGRATPTGWLSRSSIVARRHEPATATRHDPRAGPSRASGRSRRGRTGPSPRAAARTAAASGRPRPARRRGAGR